MREIIFEYGFHSINGIVKKQYHLNEVPYIREKCDVWNKLPVAFIRQFTGLTDKNGTKIFEGDIITALGKNYSICYHEAGFYLEGKNVMYRMTEKILKDEKSEVIGNIHDNPELLK